MTPVRSSSGPRVAVVTSEWGSNSEEHFVTRSVAAAAAYGGKSLALVLHHQQPTFVTSMNQPNYDGFFEVIHLNGGSFVDAATHSLLAKALAYSIRNRPQLKLANNHREHPSGLPLDHGTPHLHLYRPNTPFASPPTELVDNLFVHLYSRISLSLYHYLKEFQPTTTLIAGVHLSYLFGLNSIMRSLESTSILLPLVHGESFPEGVWYKKVFDRYDALLTATEMEYKLISPFASSNVFNIGMNIPVNQSAKNEPPPELGGLGKSIPRNQQEGYGNYLLFILTEAESIQANPSKLSEAGYLTVYTSAHLPDLPIVAVAGNRAFTLLYGKVVAERKFFGRMDLWRLMAYAKATVDTRKDLLLGREVLESMSYGVPVVVNRLSAAYQHAKTSGGGLWYSTLEELARCIDILRNDDSARSLGHKARDYVTKSYGSADNFIKQVQYLTSSKSST